MDNTFAVTGDICITNPKNCPDGVSVSVFYKAELDVDPGDLGTDLHQYKDRRETLLSTGGDYGYPGLQIYREGPVFGGILSTGEETWEVKVMGNLPKNNSWTNVALRWEPLKFTDSVTYQEARQQYKTSELGGLQLLLNLEMIGHSLLPEDECSSTVTSDCINVPTETKEPFLEGTIMVGCHKKADDAQESQFTGGLFDEVAYWNKRIPDSERHMFLGGWVESFDQLDTSELVNMMEGVDFSDPDQAATALLVLQNVISGEETTEPPFRNIYPTETSTSAKTTKSTETGNNNETTEAPKKTTTIPTTTTKRPAETPQQQKESFMGLIRVMKKLSNANNIPANLTKESFAQKVEVSRLIGDFLDPNGKNHENWELVNEDNNIEGSHEIRKSLASYVARSLERRVLEPGELFARAEVHSENSFVQYEKIANPEVRRRQVYEEETFVFPMWRSRTKRTTSGSTFRPFVVGESMEKWESFPDSIEIPLMLFSGQCADLDISFVGTIYEHFPEPGRKDPVNIKSEKIKIDSRVMSIDAFANSWDRNMEEFSSKCQPDPKLLYRKRLLVTLETKDKVKSKRQLMFHENEEKTSILRRHCAMWNPEIGMFGAWDTVDIETVAIDENSATCITDKLGTYALIAELMVLPTEYDEPHWLYVIRLVGYIMSTVLLVIFIVIVLMSAYLWEQFHILRLNLALSLIIGNAAVLLGELEMFQEDRHACTVLGCLVSYGYTASAFLLAGEAHAVFKAITGGIIDGRASAYLGLGWGTPMIALGYNIYTSIMSFGDDPKCFVGWDNVVKWQFFIPLLAGAGVRLISSCLCKVERSIKRLSNTFLLALKKNFLFYFSTLYSHFMTLYTQLSLLAMLIVVCNLATPAIRKSSILEEMSSLTAGLTVLVLLYCATWAMAPLAYIKFPALALPDFFPAFQVLNSFMGSLVFVFLGLVNVRFRAVIAGTVSNRVT